MKLRLAAALLLASVPWPALAQNANSSGGGVANGSSPSFAALTATSGSITTLTVGGAITAGSLQTPSLQAFSGTITYSGSQGAGANQFSINSITNLAGGINSGSISSSEIVIPADTVNLTSDSSGSSVTWFNVYGNIGMPQWLPTHVYTLNTKANNGGRIYVVTTAGTSASSVGPTGTGTGISDGSVTWNYVSPDFSGSRAGQQVQIDILSQNDPASPNDAYRQWQAQLLTASIHANQGGTALTGGNTKGINYSGGDQSWCFPGATFLTACVGREIDVGISTGASAIQRTSLSLVSYGQVQGSYSDTALGFGAVSGAPGYKQLIQLNLGNVYPVDSTVGAIFQALPPLAGNLAGGGLTYVNPVSPLGFDLSGLEAVIPWRSTGGFRVLENGSANIQSLAISTSGATVSIDPVGYELASATISAAGIGYKTSDDIYDPATGSVINVSTVGGSGNITALGSLVAKGHVFTTPSNPVSLTAGTGYGATANLTWTQATTLALSPSGGTTSFGGSVQFASSTTGAGTQTMTNSPCTGLTTEQWIPIKITGQTGTWYVPACQ